MSKSANLHDKNLKARLQRLMSGDFQIDDIARLHAGKRSKSFGRTSFKEIADFVAHPDNRSRGPVTDRIHDMRTTFKPLFDKALKERGASLEDIIARSESNFRIAGQSLKSC